jgi:hypothetical protein
MPVDHRFLALALAICPLTWLRSEQLIPTIEGTTWNYEMTQQSANSYIELDDSKSKEHFDVSYRIAGTQEIANLQFVKLEMYRGDIRTSTDFIRDEERGIVCGARMDASGAMLEFFPPQTMVMAPLKSGTKWKFDGKIGPTRVTQDYEIAGEEEVDLTAGKFHAWRIHCDQKAPSPATIDRWLAPGVGFVRVRTQAKAASGRVLQETLLELKEMPKIAAQRRPTPAAGGEKLTVGLSKEPTGGFTTVFNAAAPVIYAQWQGHDLPARAIVRAIWIAQDVADIATDYKIDQAEAVAPSPNSRGVFTLSAPEGGWTPGDYRVEFFVDNAPAGSVTLKITK